MNMKSKKGAKTQADIDWENRTLCSNESCIGVIGPDGRCKECGLPHGAKVPEEEPDDMADEMADSSHSADIYEDERDAPVEASTDTDWESRVLCSDESCIGVIGTDGKCKECGLPLSADSG